MYQLAAYFQEKEQRIRAQVDVIAWNTCILNQFSVELPLL